MEDKVLSIHAQTNLLAEDGLVGSMTEEASHVMKKSELKGRNKAKCLGDKMIWAYALRG